MYIWWRSSQVNIYTFYIYISRCFYNPSVQNTWGILGLFWGDFHFSTVCSTKSTRTPGARRCWKICFWCLLGRFRWLYQWKCKHVNQKTFPSRLSSTFAYFSLAIARESEIYTFNLPCYLNKTLLTLEKWAFFDLCVALKHAKIRGIWFMCIGLIQG